MRNTNNKPYIVNAENGLCRAIIIDGENKGLPFALAALISNGTLKREDVEKRGWIYEK